jgi:methionyl-tRNA synthetase
MKNLFSLEGRTALFAALSAPVIPFAAEKMANIFGLKTADLGWPAGSRAALSKLTPGAAFQLPDVLFKKIEDEEIAQWRAAFEAE